LPTARGDIARQISVPFRLARSARSVRAHAPAATTHRSAQMPIFFLSRSLTACGLALPPDAVFT
jgi:hypothetical protein